MRFVLIFFFLSAPLFFIEGDFQTSMCFSPVDTNYGSKFCDEKPNILSCCDGKFISIDRINYNQIAGSERNNCSACNKNASVTNWNIKPFYFEFILHYLCSLKETCVFNETVDAPSNESDYVWQAEISYTCIQKDILKDICSPWETTFGLDGLHIWHNKSNSEPQICSCTIEGNQTEILVVDYRPYIQEFECANSTVFINGVQHLPCSLSTGFDSSVFITLLNVTSSRINVTLEIQTSAPAMFWLYIEDSEHTHVWCNTEPNRTSQQTRQTTSTTVTKSTFASQTTLSTTEVVTKRTTIFQTNPPISPQDEEFADSGIPVSVIVGVSSGLVFLCAFIIIVIYLVRNRKSRKESRPTCNETEYNTVRFESKKKAASENMNGIINPVYDRNDKETRLHTESAQDAETDSVYSKPLDAKEDENYTEVSQTLNSYINKNENEALYFKELYGELNKNTISIDGERILNYDGNDHAYNALSGLDTYSHIHDHTGQKGASCLDSYSHVKVKNTGIYYENADVETTFYNHVEHTYNNEPLKRNTYDEDEEEYDHIGHFKPHVGESCL